MTDTSKISRLQGVTSDGTPRGVLVTSAGAIHLAMPYVANVTAYTPAAAGTATLALANANLHVIQMPAGNITIAISGASIGQVFIVEVIQDGVGSRLATWFTTIKWAEGGVPPTLTTTASKKDTFGFRCTAVGQYDGYVIGQNI